MADIKTRDAVKGTIKTIDKAAIASERMKAAYAKTKDKAEQGYYVDESSATDYASDKVSYTAERVTEEGVHQFNKQGQKGVQTTKENIVKAKDGIADFKTKRAMKSAEKRASNVHTQTVRTKTQAEKTIKQSARSTEKTIKFTTKGTVKSAEKSVKTAQSTSKAAIKTAEHTAKTAQKTAQASVKAAQRAAQAAKATAKATAHAVKVAVKATIAAVKAIIAGTKALISAIAAGGWVVVTRELKSIGVEVFFIEDNIWTMDGDGELRLSLMATLAQEESRKTSERVKAGQKISRDNGVLYGNGNILGYDRVGDTYVINEEQAETVRMIYDLYLQGYGSMKIAGILTERKRKTASGLVKWSVSNIMRAIRNATYTGTKCYNKSRSNNFLEQKRINNLDMSTYEYVEGDFPAIISQEIWDKAQEIRESRVKPSLVSATKTTHSKRDSADVWVNKLRCSCGSSFRKNKWHTKLDGKTSYGYQCYNQLNNGNKKKREELGLDTDGYCDTRMITDWKLDFMAKALLEHLWTERRKSVLIAIDLIKYYYKEERENGKQSDAVVVQARLDKANTRLTNLIAMRADGEITKDEYQVMRTPIDTEIQELQKALENIPTESDNSKGFDLDGIISTLNSLVDFSGNTISHDVINQFVYMVTPTSDTTFEWYVNLNGKPNVKATFTAEGRKKNCLIRLEEIERISSLHRKENESNAQLIKNPCLLTYLHRLPSRRACNPRR